MTGEMLEKGMTKGICVMRMTNQGQTRRRPSHFRLRPAWCFRRNLHVLHCLSDVLLIGLPMLWLLSADVAQRSTTSYNPVPQSASGLPSASSRPSAVYRPATWARRNTPSFLTPSAATPCAHLLADITNASQNAWTKFLF